MTAVALALRHWRDSQARFPDFTRRSLPDDLDLAMGHWERSLIAVVGVQAPRETGGGRVRYEPRWYSTAMCRGEPHALFCFGDNVERSGCGPKSGQAWIRHEPNAVGIVVKHAPARTPRAYFTDADIRLFQAINGPTFAILAHHLRLGGTVVWPGDGIGTGRAELPARAPRLWASLERARLRLEGIVAGGLGQAPGEVVESEV